MVYTTTMLMEKYNDYSNAFNKIQRDCKNGKLVKIIRGLYEDNPSVDPSFCSGYIYGPSYISFDYVLSKAGLIPEFAPNITCASFKKNKVKQYNTPIGTFLYHDVPEKAFPYGTDSVIEDGYSYVVASPEKALCDKLYIVSQVSSYREFKELLFNNLRIDEEMLHNLNWQIIKELAPLYRKSNLDYLLKYLQKR